jgi:hypothetical protein
MRKILLLFLFFIIIEHNAKSQSAIYKCSSVFIGNPSESYLKNKMDTFMSLYRMQQTDDNYLKLGNALLTLRKDSKKGVTEVQILLLAIRLYRKNIDMGSCLGLAASNLELR